MSNEFSRPLSFRLGEDFEETRQSGARLRVPRPDPHRPFPGARKQERLNIEVRRYLCLFSPALLVAHTPDLRGSQDNPVPPGPTLRARSDLPVGVVRPGRGERLDVESPIQPLLFPSSVSTVFRLTLLWAWCPPPSGALSWCVGERPSHFPAQPYRPCRTPERPRSILVSNETLTGW